MSLAYELSSTYPDIHLALRLGEDHLAHHRDAAFVEEHVFRATEPEPVHPEVPGHARLGRGVGVGPHPEVAGYYATRAGATDKWLHGMNKLQQRLEDKESTR